jgi:LacI family transcriptional regulator
MIIQTTKQPLTAENKITHNNNCSRDAVAHLVAQGHRRIAFIGDTPTTLYTRLERFRGYKTALDGAGLRVDPALVVHAHETVDSAAITQRLLALPDPPTAIFAANNLVCMGVVTALSRAHRWDVAIVGFDDFTLADAFEPGITVMAQDTARLGTTAAELALARLHGDRSRARTVTLPTTLLRRGSGEIPVAALV